jgi:hypothetical protein
VTWQPESDLTGEEPAAGWAMRAGGGPAEDLLPGGQDDAGQDDAGGDYPAGPDPSPRRGRWAAMVAVLALGLCGLAGGAAGAVRQLLPREFSPAQQQQIQNWELTKRWRLWPAGQIFPATVGYQVSADMLNGTQGLGLTARRLGIAPQSSCGTAVSAAAAKVLAAAHCAAMLRATYVDASGSMVVTLGVAALPTAAAAMTAAPRLAAASRDQGLAVHALAVARSPAASFRQPQRQYSTAYQVGPYIVLATAGFTDGRRHVQLNTDDYYEEEMSSLANGLAAGLARRIGKGSLALPTCPGAPGC